MSKISNVQYELSIVKVLLDTKSPELLVKLTPEYFGVKDVGNLFRLIKGFYIDHGTFLGWDALKAELSARVPDTDKCKFLCGLVDDVRERDVSGLTESYLLDELRKQLQFRIALSGVGEVVNAVEKKDADAVVGSIQGLYEKMFADSATEGLSCRVWQRQDSYGYSVGYSPPRQLRRKHGYHELGAGSWRVTG